MRKAGLRLDVVRRAPNVERILDAFSGPEPTRDGRPAGLSAVLLALYETPEGPALLYTKRSAALRSHPGEISFPGGRVDATDEGPRAAAIREAREEVGLDPAHVTRVSHLVDYVTFRSTMVCAYVARVAGDAPARPASLDEVEEVFLVPLDALLDPANYEARRLDGVTARDRRVHYWHLGHRIMWGITGELTAIFLQRACGWTLPPEVRTVHDVADLIPR